MNLNDLAELEHEELKMLSVTGFRDDMAAEFKDHEGAIDMHLIHPDVASQGSDIDDPSHSVFNFKPKELTSLLMAYAQLGFFKEDKKHS